NIHTERRNRLSPIRVAKMAQVSWYIKQNEKKSQPSEKKINEIEGNISDDDYNDCSDNIDEFMVNLNQMSEKLIDDIHVLDINSGETIPALIDIFDFNAVEKSLNFYFNQS
ncbi:4298_t:CDS:1, partial [Dentiscutata heterogama]